MTDPPPKPKRTRWLVIFLTVVMVAAVLSIGFNYALQQRRLRTWAQGVQKRGISAFVLAELSDVDPGPITNRVRMILSGRKCVIAIENQDQAETLLDVAADCPLRLELKIKPGVPADATQRLREKFPTADIEVNSSTELTNPRWRAPLEQQQAK